MLLQYDGPRIFLFPAWPPSWAGPGSSVNFSLWAPADTRVDGPAPSRRPVPDAHARGPCPRSLVRLPPPPAAVRRRAPPYAAVRRRTPPYAAVRRRMAANRSGPRPGLVIAAPGKVWQCGSGGDDEAAKTAR
jgi:hypothetical protein